MRHLAADSSGSSQVGCLRLRKKYSERKDFCFYQVETLNKRELISKLGFGKGHRGDQNLTQVEFIMNKKTIIGTG